MPCGVPSSLLALASRLLSRYPDNSPTWLLRTLLSSISKWNVPFDSVRRKLSGLPDKQPEITLSPDETPNGCSVAPLLEGCAPWPRTMTERTNRSVASDTANLMIDLLWSTTRFRHTGRGEKLRAGYEAAPHMPTFNPLDALLLHMGMAHF